LKAFLRRGFFAAAVSKFSLVAALTNMAPKALALIAAAYLQVVVGGPIWS
jgi:hypothetical protein